MIKRLFVMALLFGTMMSVSAATKPAKADTVAVDANAITKWIADTTTTSRGNLSIKYYVLYKGELVNTNRTTMNNVKLCKKYGAKAALIMITSASGRRRIVSK